MQSFSKLDADELKRLKDEQGLSKETFIKREAIKFAFILTLESALIPTLKSSDVSNVEQEGMHLYLYWNRHLYIHWNFYIYF